MILISLLQRNISARPRCSLLFSLLRAYLTFSRPLECQGTFNTKNICRL